jgi:predicted CoA-binding protein
LVQAYYDYYPLIRGRMVPDWFMDRIKKFYLRQADRRFSLSQFAQTVTRSAGWNPNVKTGQAERGIDMFQNPTDEQRAKLLKEAKTIAVVGCSDNPERTSYLIAEALQRAGYRIIPVNPNLTRPVLGEKPYASLTEIDEPIDIVNVFRRSEAVLPIAKEAVEVGTKGIWMQLGVVNEEAARLAQENGLMVIMDRCIKVDHAILLGKKA